MVLVYGKIVLINLLDSDDVCYMLNVLIVLGVSYMFLVDCMCCEIIGNGGLLYVEGVLELFFGNVGMVMCLLVVVFCLGSNDIVLIGELCMKECLIGYLVDVLCLGGVKIIYLE